MDLFEKEDGFCPLELQKIIKFVNLKKSSNFYKITIKQAKQVRKALQTINLLNSGKRVIFLDDAVHPSLMDQVQLKLKVFEKYIETYKYIYPLVQKIPKRESFKDNFENGEITLQDHLLIILLGYYQSLLFNRPPLEKTKKGTQRLLDKIEQFLKESKNKNRDYIEFHLNEIKLIKKNNEMLLDMKFGYDV